MRLLLVDDDQDFIHTLGERLSMRDFDVKTVTNGTEAIEEAHRKEFDVALVDLRMPGMGGEDVLKKLKEYHPLIEVIILTGHGTIDSAVRCTQAGSYNYLEKPCGIEELFEVFRTAYEKRMKKKLKLPDEKVRKLVGLSLVESPLGMIMRLRDTDEKEDD